MSLAVVIDALAERLSGRLPGVLVGDAEPGGATDLPAVTLAIAGVTEEVAGIGRVPRGTRTGALEVTLDVDLANPVLDLGGGESLLLVPADRRSLTLPHGPLVRADGTPDAPFGASDLLVRDTSAWTVVAAAPTGKQVRPDVDAGLLRFGQPLPTSGTLHVEHHIGVWDTVVSRYQGRLDVRVAAQGTALKTLARNVAVVLAERHPGVRLAPRAWAAATRPDPTAGLPNTARVQLVTYRFDAEIEQPLLTSGGGVITDVSVTGTEHFDIVRTPLGGQG